MKNKELPEGCGEMKELDYSEEVSNSLVGRKIASAKVNGHYVELTFEDGDVFEYDASDGGYSFYGIKKAEGEK